MGKLKLKNTLAKTNYVQTLIVRGVCEIKTSLVNFEDHKLNQQLVNDVVNFIEKEIQAGKYSKEDFDKSGIITEIMQSTFGPLTEDEIKLLESSIQFILDNNLVKKKTMLQKGLQLGLHVASFVLSKK